MPTSSDVSLLLDRVRAGDADAFGQLVGMLYDELRRVAQSQRRRLGAAATVNTTAVVHEAYAKLAHRGDRAGGLPFVDQAHFLRVAARTMRDVLVDYARAQQAEKRGGGPSRPLAEAAPGALAVLPSVSLGEVLDLDRSLDRLEALDAEQARLVELRYFGGLTISEAAEALGLSEATAKRRWSVARAWLYRELSG